MKIAIVGSRNIKKLNISDYINASDVSLIVSGGAMGIDTIAEKWAKQNGIDTLIFKPEYEKFGRVAPIIRNKTIVENADIVYAFWDGKSKGTKNSIDNAKRLNKKCNVIML